MGEEFTINVPKVVAVRACQVAAQTHRRTEDVLVEWLDRGTDEPFLAKSEAELLRNINVGLSEAQWQRYHALVAKRRAETITPDEFKELVAFSDQIEKANARRITYLIELAKLRSISLESLMQDLGITTPAYV